MDLLGWFRRVRPRADLRFTLITRQGCHLCDDARRLLDAARRRYGFELTSRDVDADPGLVEAYGHCVPVVLVNGKVRFRGKVNDVLLRRILDGPATVE